MKFFLEHMALVFGSIGTGIFLYACFALSRPLQMFNASSLPIRFLRYWTAISAICLIAIALFGYAGRSAFYHPKHHGAVGDSYHYLSNTLLEPGYFNPQHLMYPVIPGFWIPTLETFKCLSRDEALFYEKAWIASVLPIQVALLLALTVLLFAFRYIGWTWLDSLLGTLFMSVTAASWSWAHQSNAMGFIAATEMIAISSFWWWMRSLRSIAAVASAISLALCIYAQAATVYFVVTCYVFLSANMLWKTPRHVRAWGIMTSLLGLIAAPYYVLSAKWAKSVNPFDIFHRIADTSAIGGFSVRPSALPWHFKDNIVNTIVNLFNVWDPQSRFDTLLIGLEIVSIVFCFLLLVKNRQMVKRLVVKNEFMLPALCSVVIFLAFLVRDAGSRYFATIAVPNAILLTAFLLNCGTIGRLAVQSLIVLMFLFSGFSTYNVFEIADPMANPAYRICTRINMLRASGRPALFMGFFDTSVEAGDRYQYRDEAVKNYYGPRFSEITWIWQEENWRDRMATRAALVNALSRGVAVFLNDEVAETVKRSPEFEIEPVDKNLNLVVVRKPG